MWLLGAAHADPGQRRRYGYSGKTLTGRTGGYWLQCTSDLAQHHYLQIKLEGYRSRILHGVGFKEWQL